jgi:heme/copper-type cytochrome/quinol oxidase subunit 3
VSALPLTTEATDAVAVKLALERRKGPPAALWGMGMLIASEAMLFSAFIATYFYLRFETVVWPPRGIQEPKWIVPAILVAILALTSIPMQLAWMAVRDGRVATARIHLIAAFVVQAGYFAYEVHDFDTQLHATQITHNAYTSIYYTLLGADHAHVFIGLVFDVWLLAKLARGLTVFRANATQAITWYWHFVNVVTIVVLATRLSARA